MVVTSFQLERLIPWFFHGKPINLNGITTRNTPQHRRTSPVFGLETCQQQQHCYCPTTALLLLLGSSKRQMVSLWLTFSVDLHQNKQPFLGSLQRLPG